MQSFSSPLCWHSHCLAIRFLKGHTVRYFILNSICLTLFLCENVSTVILMMLWTLDVWCCFVYSYSTITYHSCLICATPHFSCLSLYCLHLLTFCTFDNDQHNFNVNIWCHFVNLCSQFKIYTKHQSDYTLQLCSSHSLTFLCLWSLIEDYP